MIRLQIITLLILLSLKMYGQIDMNDSTAQVIGYWDKNEKQSYVVTQEEYKIVGNDTTSRESYKYLVDITVVDSTADSYLIDWFYKDYEIHSDNALVKKLASITSDITVRIKTSELGVFQEVVSWEAIRDYILQGTKILKQETQDIPNMDNIINQIEGMYSTKESIENAAVMEMQQYYTFHGAKYEYGEEYNIDLKSSNLYGGEPFDTKVKVWLDEINPDENNFVLRMIQTVDSEQLTKATYEYLLKMAETLKIPSPKIEDIPLVSNDVWTASRIHGSGWVIYSVETRETKAEGQTNVKERIIEIL